MNIISNFQRVSGANDDNILKIDVGVGTAFVDRGIFIDYSNSQRKIKKSDFDGKSIVFKMSGNVIFTIQKDDLPPMMKDSDYCGVEVANLLLKRLFAQSFTKSVRFVANYAGYDNCVLFSHNADISIEWGELSDFIKWFNGGTVGGFTIKDYTTIDTAHKYTLFVDSVEGLKATAEKSGTDKVDFNLRHIIGVPIKKPIEFNLSLIEETAAKINNVEIMNSVLVLPNSPSLVHNTEYKPIQWLSDRSGGLTRSVKGKELILSALNLYGFNSPNDNATHKLRMEKRRVDYTLISVDDVSFDSLLIDSVTNKVANISIAGYYTADTELAFIDFSIVDVLSDTKITDTISVEFVDYCTAFEMPNFRYLNAVGGIDTFNLFDAKTTQKKAENATQYKGLLKSERGIATRSYTGATELKTQLLNKAEYDMITNLCNSLEVKNENGVVLCGKVDASWAATDTAKQLTLTIDEAL